MKALKVLCLFTIMSLSTSLTATSSMMEDIREVDTMEPQIQVFVRDGKIFGGNKEKWETCVKNEKVDLTKGRGKLYPELGRTIELALLELVEQGKLVEYTYLQGRDMREVCSVLEAAVFINAPCGYNDIIGDRNPVKQWFRMYGFEKEQYTRMIDLIKNLPEGKILDTKECYTPKKVFDAAKKIAEEVKLIVEENEKNQKDDWMRNLERLKTDY